MDQLVKFYASIILEIDLLTLPWVPLLSKSSKMFHASYKLHRHLEHLLQYLEHMEHLE